MIGDKLQRLIVERSERLAHKRRPAVAAIVGDEIGAARATR
jgi:hypothetical protein